MFLLWHHSGIGGSFVQLKSHLHLQTYRYFFNLYLFEFYIVYYFVYFYFNESLISDLVYCFLLFYEFFLFLLVLMFLVFSL